MDQNQALSPANVFDVISPHTEQPIAEVLAAGPADIDAAVIRAVGSLVAGDAIEEFPESFAALGREADPFCAGPGFDFSQGFLAPAVEQKDELHVEGHHAFGEVESFGEHPSGGQEFLYEHTAGGVGVPSLTGGGLQGCAQVFGVPLVGKKQAKHPLDLEGGRRRLSTEPFLEGGTAGGGDRISGALAALTLDELGLSVAALDDSFQLRI